MRKLGILFGDNDFYYTFNNVMVNILESYELNPNEVSKFSKEQITEVINGLSLGCYWLYQNRFRYKLGWNARAYLYIKEDRVLVDEEVDEYLKDTGRHNGEFHWVDFAVGKIHCT